MGTTQQHNAWTGRDYDQALETAHRSSQAAFAPLGAASSGEGKGGEGCLANGEQSVYSAPGGLETAPYASQGLVAPYPQQHWGGAASNWHHPPLPSPPWTAALAVENSNPPQPQRAPYYAQTLRSAFSTHPNWAMVLKPEQWAPVDHPTQNGTLPHPPPGLHPQHHSPPLSDAPVPVDRSLPPLPSPPLSAHPPGLPDDPTLRALHSSASVYNPYDALLPPHPCPQGGATTWALTSPASSIWPGPSAASSSNDSDRAPHASSAYPVGPSAWDESLRRESAEVAEVTARPESTSTASSADRKGKGRAVEVPSREKEVSVRRSKKTAPPPAADDDDDYYDFAPAEHGGKSKKPRRKRRKMGEPPRDLAQRKYICELCPGNEKKSFARPSALKIHMLTHTKEKPHVCPSCQRTFAIISNLRRHQKLHDADGTSVSTPGGDEFNGDESEAGPSYAGGSEAEGPVEAGPSSAPWTGS